MKNSWLALVLLSVLAFASGGCASSRPAAPGYASGDPSARPPETGTNIPRRLREGGGDRRTEAKPKRKKAKPRQSAQPQVEEEIVTRGGFR